MKKENTGKIFPEEIILRGDRFFPEEYFNPAVKRDIFNKEKVDLEDLSAIGTLAEGQDFIGAYNTDKKLVKFNEYKNWEKSLCFRPDYDNDVILVGKDWIDIAERPVVYFLLEEKVNYI